MMMQRCMCMVMIGLIGSNIYYTDGRPHRILLDTDVDTDDVFALLYILKLDTSIFDLQALIPVDLELNFLCIYKAYMLKSKSLYLFCSAVTINVNSWSNAGHAINQVYDLLYMMGRDDIAVGVGGEGGILEDGTILPNVGGYLPIIEQGNGTAGYCRYSQAIPVGLRGKLDIDTKYGFRKSFLPQGSRRYSPLRQPTAQQVMIDKISAGPITVFIIGANTNLAIFLMSNPHLKKNIKHIYIMGGAVRPQNSTCCCPEDSSSSCKPSQCCDMGNVYTGYNSNPYAECNMFSDPFAAYQVIHSGIPVTLVPLDATNTIPITKNLFTEFENNQHTYEAQFCFKSLKMAHDTWWGDQFFKSYCMWDSFLSGVATSIMLGQNNTNGENEFAEMEYMNITVITSNKPYGISDGSNPFFYGLKKPKFNLTRNGVHSGHVQNGLSDPFCIAKNGCKDGFTAEVSGRKGVHVLVAVKAKPNRHKNSLLNREYFISFLDVLNRQTQTGKFNFTTQFPHYREVVYKPDFRGRRFGKNVVFDMDMSAGDFLTLFYLLKLPVEVISLKAIIVSPTGWANAATIDVIYDLLHMMGRDDIPVGLGDYFALNQSDPNYPAAGDCKYNRAIPHGSGGYLDSDTLYGLARDLPRSPRRYTAENSVKFGAPRDTHHPELRQPLALEIWQSVIKSLDPGSKVTVLTNGPLTNVARIILADIKITCPIQDIIIVGGHISKKKNDTGNVINIPSNKYAEMNMFLDPLAAKTVFESSYNITLIPLNVQRTVCRFDKVLKRLRLTKETPESLFVRRLLSRLHRLKRTHPRYQHMDMFLGEIVGAIILAGNSSFLKTNYATRNVEVLATGAESEDGRIIIDGNKGRSVKVLEHVDPHAYYTSFANRLGDEKQSAIRFKSTIDCTTGYTIRLYHLQSYYYLLSLSVTSDSSTTSDRLTVEISKKDPVGTCEQSAYSSYNENNLTDIDYNSRLFLDCSWTMVSSTMHNCTTITLSMVNTPSQFKRGYIRDTKHMSKSREELFTQWCSQHICNLIS
ncbi:probable uridine nucleosidase 1 [Phtheirospermum japonicum]|uniref:Probable uridine nucleosidase 1 n=1 Tax=Phtheirospermum japonicum TaxID=374723 RepID=A0A830CMQ9_9LAMI|nr:probable uridine nucleosidase 1 [Phtheirospermum japonicum]